LDLQSISSNVKGKNDDLSFKDDNYYEPGVRLSIKDLLRRTFLRSVMVFSIWQKSSLISQVP
jgi:hypothetical protein